MQPTSHLNMTLPSKEEACRSAVDGLVQVLAVQELQAAAQGTSPPTENSVLAKLASLEETLQQNSRLARDHATILLSKLRVGFPAPGASGGGSCNPAALPKIVDFPTFVHQSRLVRERVQRVVVTLGSVRNVRLLSEASTGRHLITERASVAVTELLGVLLALEAAMAGTPAPLVAGRSTARARYVVRDARCSSGILGATATEAAHAAADTLLVDAGQRETPAKPTSIVSRPRKGETGKDPQRGTTATPSNLAGERNGEVNDNKSGEELKPARNFPGRKPVPPHEAEANEESGPMATPKKSTVDTPRSSPSCLSASSSPSHLDTGERIPIRKGDSSALAPTYVAAHSRIFRGELWRELLRKEDAVVPPRWKELFIQDVGALFGIPHEWVSDVRLVNEQVTSLTGGDQKVTFKVRLPLSLEENEVHTRIQQHEFMSMLLLYEELQRDRDEDAEEQESKRIVEYGANSCTLSANDDVSRSVSPSDFSDTAAPSSDVESSSSRNGIAAGGGSPNCGNNETLQKAFAALTSTETLSRDSLVIQEKYGRKIAMRALPQRQPLSVQGRQGAIRPSHASSQQQRNRVEEKTTPSETCEVAGKDFAPKSLDAVPRRGLPPLPPRTATPPCLDPASAATPERGKTGMASPPSSPSPVRNGCEILHAAGHQDWDIFRNSASSPDSKLAASSEPGNALGPKKALEPTVQWLYTSHEKYITGEHWDLVLAKEENKLRRTFTAELAALFELPKENVRALKFTLGGLHATFELMHDRYLKETEINALIRVFDFPQVRSLYQRCMKDFNASPPCLADNVNGDGNELRNTNSPDVRRQASPTRGGTATTTSPLRNVRAEKTPCTLAGEEYTISSPLQQPPPRSPDNSLLENAASPDNEPVTFAHLALVHDLPVEALLRANPHLAAFGAKDALPSSTQIVIPRPTSDDEEDAEERSSRGTTPSAVGQAAPAISTSGEGDKASSKLLAGMKRPEGKLRVGVQALGQQSSLPEPGGDAQSRLGTSSTNVPVQLLAGADLLAAVSSGRGSKKIPAMPRAVRGLGAMTATTAGHAEETKSAGGELKGASQWQPAQMTETKQEQMLTAGTMQQERSQHVQESLQSRRVMTQRPLRQSQSQTPYLSNSFQIPVSQPSSKRKNAAVRTGDAVVLMLRSVEQFVLLRFFAKWQYIAQLRKVPRASLAVQGVSLNGSQTKSPVETEPFTSPSQRPNPGGVLTPRNALSPKTEAALGQSAGFIAKTMEAIARTANRSVSAQETEYRISSGGAADTSPKQQHLLQRGVYGARAKYVPALRIIAGGEQIRQSPLQYTPEDAITSPLTHCGYCDTPRLSFGEMGSNHSRSRASSTDMEVNGVSDSAMAERSPLGIHISSLLTIIEAHGEAEAAGIERGDQLREMEGMRVRTLRDVRNVLASVGGTHVCLGILKKAVPLLQQSASGEVGGTQLRVRRLRQGARQPQSPELPPCLKKRGVVLVDSATKQARGEFVPEREGRSQISPPTNFNAWAKWRMSHADNVAGAADTRAAAAPRRNPVVVPLPPDAQQAASPAACATAAIGQTIQYISIHIYVSFVFVMLSFLLGDVVRLGTMTAPEWLEDTMG
ncbi:uncharacterized protein Tco025E_01593 [Trypanosoma conorhini]|uniref:Flagellar attachment zone protein 1 conserved domain-containing protein n=1 Tax=Trypanosoma conorhini TaxID=83891 RepID=A0A3R7M3Z0_9TRYP|nr:uncharacterized protein Tco025E_01593 [Trypanosoma conorhini]RNF26148.1 hypothetical protein Tco025E_01593 [Trypanosoma conorhini]